jgi:NAD(P)-dependent dehydrogenase (short-subunit alcohol dehydrogenase family)
MLPVLAESPGAKRVAIVVGVGPISGIGGAATARFANEGYHVFALGRTEASLKATVAEIEKRCVSGTVTPIVLHSISGSPGFKPADIDGAALEREIIDAFAKASAAGRLDLVVQNMGPNMPPPTGRDMRDMTVDFLHYMWQVNMLISFLVGREAARLMVPKDKAEVADTCGTLVFIGATASLRGKPPYLAFAHGKAGVRMLAQSMAREYGSKGLHVAHLIVDGMVDGDRIRTLLGKDFEKINAKTGSISADSIAETVWQLHVQHPSAWTHELEVRNPLDNW